MDIQALLGQLLSKESIQGLSQTTGTSKKETKNVLSEALPLLLNGANAQAQDASTAAGFASALSQHAATNTGDLSAFFQNVDLTDGAKIVGHLLGAKADESTQTVSQKAGVSASNTSSILSAAAPLLMSLMGQQAKEEKEDSSNVAGLLTALLGKSDISSLAASLLGSLKDDDEDDKKEDKKEEKKGGFSLGNLAKLLSGLLK